MRSAPITFSAIDQSSSKAPRFVAAVIYEVGSIYVTSHAGIANVPGHVIHGALAEPSITSQRLRPDEAAAEIGSASFSLVDIDGSFTEAVRTRLGEGAGLRGKQVRFWLGYEGLPFEDYALVGTQIVSNASYADGKYTVQCLDIQRSLRTDLFEPQTTTLGASVAPADTTITLTSTAGLYRVQHGPSYTDAPHALCGYVKIKNEVIRYSEIDGNQLIGCERGVFGTVASAYTVDPATPADRREKVSEYIYLEMPAMKLAYALLTGNIYGSSDSLPPKWHLGISPDLIAAEDFYRIGLDLWNPVDDNAGLVVRFQGIAKTDGKRFLEKELFLMAGVYAPVYADGRLGLRRAVRLREDAATVLTLDDSNSVQVGALTHDMAAVYNSFLVNWSWNGEEYRRATAYVDTVSREKHGAAETFTLNFRGLHGARHTDGVIFQLLDLLRDRYAGPPLRLSVDVLHSLNRIEIGDVVRGRWFSVRDFTGQTSAIDRAFEVQSVSVSHHTGRVTLELFASTADATASAPTRATVALPDAYYTAAGTDLTAAPGVSIVGGVLSAAAQPLVGSADINAPASIYYYNGDLTIAAGVVLTVAQNVQLRIRGFLTCNGAIVGRGRGHAGVADDGRGLAFPGNIEGDGPFVAEAIPGNRGYVGSVRGYDGIRTRLGVAGTYLLSTWPPELTTSVHAVAPRLLLQLDNASLKGLPTDLRGAGGAPGGRIGNANVPYPMEGRGGAGAGGGAGLCIVCRGMSIGANGYIDLSGEDSAPTASVSQTGGLVRFPGSGAPGGPGTMYVLLDGGNISIPDFAGNKFRARAGIAPVPDANSLVSRRANGHIPQSSTYGGNAPQVFSPLRGFDDADFHANNGKDSSGSALVVQYVPGVEVPGEDDERPAPPYGLSTESIEQGVWVRLSLPDFGEFDSVQLYASKTNNRSDAIKVAEGKFDTFRHRVPDGAAFRYWARTKKASTFSTWFPEGATAGVLGAALGGLIARGGAEAFGTTAGKPSNVPQGWNADVYSAETYIGGAFLSFQPRQANAALVVGINSDPESDPGFASVDHAWRLFTDGHAEIYESGASVGNAGSYTALTVFGIKYDGQILQYLKDGAVLRTVQRPNISFFFDSSFDTPGSFITNIKHGPMTTAPSIPYVARGQCVATATTIRKEGGTSAWDSDAYSWEAFRGGAFISFQPERSDTALMAGFNADPLTDQSYTSIDFAWYCTSEGILQIYESGGYVLAAGAYTSTTVLAIAYDGRVVRYLKNGVLMREVYSPDRTFHFDASFASPGAAIRNVTFSAYGAATPVPFISRSTSIIVSDVSAQKIPGTASSWDADFISINGYPIAHIEFKTSHANINLMCGLNSDPFTDQSYTSIDAAWHPASDGNAYIYMAGTNVMTGGAYSTLTVFAITYDGSAFRFYKDNILIHTAAAAGLTVFADASIYTPGAGVISLRFGPGSVLSLLDTAQLRPDAATVVLQKITAPATYGGWTYNGSSADVSIVPVDSLTFVNNSQYTVPVLCDYKTSAAIDFQANAATYSMFLEVTGAASYAEGTQDFRIDTLSPSFKPRSGSVVVNVPPNSSVTMSVNIRMFFPAGFYQTPQIFVRDTVLNMQGIKR